MMNRKSIDDIKALKTLTWLSSEKLLRCFMYVHDNFDPLDYELCELYEALKNEIVNRMQKGETK